MLRALAVIAVVAGSASGEPLPALPVVRTQPEPPARPTIFEVIGGIATRFQGGTQAGSLGVRGMRSDWSAELGFDLALPETRAMVDVSRGGAALAVCRHLGPVALCPIANVGWIHGSGPGVESSTSPLVSVGGRLAAELQISHRFAFRARVDGRVVLTSTALTSRGEGWLGIDVIVRISR